MIVSRTPYRISFFGGGTDYPTWFREHGGAVLATTINRYCYISCRFLPPFFEHRSRVVWSQIEMVANNSEIQHPVIRAATEYLDIKDGIEIHYNGDLPARSGLGSSSSFTVGVLNALYSLKGQMASKKTLADGAIHVEQVLLQENVGVQDQIQTAFGGLNRIEIKPDGSYYVAPVPLPQERIEDMQKHMLLFYTGVSRNASDIAAAQISAMPDRTKELHTMRQLVDEAVSILSSSGNMTEFGKLLHETWLLKRQLSDRIAPGFVNEIYERARAAGALGGKLLGAGGGGFMLFCVRPEDHVQVLEALSDLLVVPIQFDWGGTQIVYYAPTQYSRTSHERRDFKRYWTTGSNDVEPEGEA